MTTTKKSLASTARAWFRTKVLDAYVPCLARGRRAGIYPRTVRGETRIPSLTRSSSAIRSSPEVRLAAAIVAINCCRSAGIGGRPGARDFQRHQSRNPFRCHRISVSGSRGSAKCRQSTNGDKAIRVIRVASSARRGFTGRSHRSYATVPSDRNRGFTDRQKNRKNRRDLSIADHNVSV